MFNLQGSIVALVTPMDEDGTIDWQSFKDLIEWHINSGSSGLVIVGTTGESATLNVAEHVQVIENSVKIADGRIKIIGVGGVDSGKSAYDKFLAGANYVQLYTGMVFRGPNIVNMIKKELKELLLKDGVKNFTEIIGKK